MKQKLGKIRRYETPRRGKTGKKLLAALLLLLLLFFGWLVLSPDPEGVLILEYHMVDTQEDEDSHPYNVPPEDFAAQLDDLAQQGYTTITVHDFLLAKKGKAQLPEKPIILTFDDGYEDNYTQMLPILQAHGMTAVVYVATNLIGQPGYLSWDELRALSAAGLEIGGHTADHQPLHTFTPQEQQDQIHLSKLLLEWNGLPTVYEFSYPNGDHPENLPAMLKENEYLSAVTGDAGYNTFDTDPYLLQRVNIPHPRFGIAEFRLRLFKAKVMTLLDIRQHHQ